MMQITYKTIVIRSEPREDIYRQLLQFACKHCKLFSLNWTEGGPLYIQKEPIADKLKPFLVKETLTKWRQFTLSHNYYQLTAQSSKIIATAKSLYLWHEPGFPKDLAIYVDENNPWLISDTQNKKAFIFVQGIPFDAIRDEIKFLDLEIEKPILAIDGINFYTLDEFYDEISNKLIPDAEWGKDLDGFHDILWGGFGTPSYGFVLTWRNSYLSRERLGYPETIKQLEKRKLHCHPSAIPSIEHNIEKAKKNEGATAFDWIVEIIEGHDTIDLRLE